jgi:hypothetical protein
MTQPAVSPRFSPPDVVGDSLLSKGEASLH